MVDLIETSCADFAAALASDAPVPGGGGAAALVGAVGTALGNMVGSLTVGKKKYADSSEKKYAKYWSATTVSILCGREVWSWMII